MLGAFRLRFAEPTARAGAPVQRHLPRRLAEDRFPASLCVARRKARALSRHARFHKLAVELLTKRFVAAGFHIEMEVIAVGVVCLRA